MSFIEGHARGEVSILPPCIDDYVAPEALVRVVDAFVASLNLTELGFCPTVAAATGRPGFDPADILRLYIWGYLNQLSDQGALDRMEARIYADPSLMVTRRCTVEHPFGTIKRMSGGGRFLTRRLRRVKAEAALSILAYNILHAVNAFGAHKLTPAG